jgi:hypothetical protein
MMFANIYGKVSVGKFQDPEPPPSTSYDFPWAAVAFLTVAIIAILVIPRRKSD